jgi:hypothetical protein
VLLRGASTNPSLGTLAGGYFGGGINDNLRNFGARSDFDIEVLWEFQNLLFGNAARVREQQAGNRLAVLELFGIQDRVAKEVAEAYAQAQSAVARIVKAESGLKNAVESAEKNFTGLGQTKTVAGTVPGSKVLVLVIRPQEVVAAVQALSQAYGDYYGAVNDYNRAQFRLYRALGHPAQFVAGQGPTCPVPPLGNLPPAEARPVEASPVLPASSRLNTAQDSPINRVDWRTWRPDERSSGRGP